MTPALTAHAFGFSNISLLLVKGERLLAKIQTPYTFQRQVILLTVKSSACIQNPTRLPDFPVRQYYRPI